ncbi:hypothetical protein HJFPF1_11887 [Paramyrothecium foliicola]|nr:hypothetical protein HJFPF1_11887 [Paramyrothecium foliicola]
MSGTNKKHTARSVIDAFYGAERVFTTATPESRDFSGIAAVLSPDIQLEQPSGLPYAGVYKGPQGILDWISKAGQWFDKIDVQNPEFFEREGSDRIAVLSTVNYTVKSTGEELYFPFSQTFTVDLEKGVITEIRPFYWDVHALNKAIGYAPKA